MATLEGQVGSRVRRVGFSKSDGWGIQKDCRDENRVLLQGAGLAGRVFVEKAGPERSLVFVFVI